LAWKHYTEAGVLRLEFTAIVTGRDLQEIAADAPVIEAGFPNTPHRISDFEGAMGVELRFSDIDALAGKRRATKFPNSFKSAIVAPQPVQLEFARMYQALSKNPQVTIRFSRTSPPPKRGWRRADRREIFPYPATFTSKGQFFASISSRS
jgi:hypothetical protein